ncbi:MAG: hypothetical protein LBJ87_05075 [bacterium]|jgi:hypothetical protein|nr:hypothetical protein [bacterium]
MATRYPRIGVIKDPELQAALQLTRGLLDRPGTGSEAGQVRQLALIGARALAAQAPEGQRARRRQRVLDHPGVRAATRTIGDLDWLTGERVDGERRASRALEWVRGET